MTDNTLQDRLHKLYYGGDRRSRIFHGFLIAVDIAAVVYFLATVQIAHVAFYKLIDITIFVLFSFEFGMRFLAEKRRRLFWLHLSTIADLVVLASLILPVLVENLAFLRILRAIRFLRLFHIGAELRRMLPVARRQEDVFDATLNLVVFVFVVTSTVWVLEARVNPELNNWIDALYFTVTTLTTTGFGDITLDDPVGRLLTIFIMVFGVALFFRLAQSIFRPFKVHHTCQICGLTRHDPDASHCKHCGNVIRIETEGNW
jgi:voltage-gated potassium channel